MTTEFGTIAHLTQAVEDERSPLQQEMAHTTKIVTLIAGGVGLVFFGLAVALAGVTLAESCIFAIGMIVAFVPAGLLPTVTLALAMGTQRMARRHALIKRLSAVETLGCTTVICTDKTGTLTQNEMTVCEIWLAGRQLTVTGVGYAPEGQLLEQGHPMALPVDADVRQVLVAAGLCNNARVLPHHTLAAQWTILGDPTEAALRVVASKAGIDLAAEAQQMPRLREIPFDAHRKRMSTMHQPASTLHATPIAYVKGAPKEVLALCTRILLHGQACPLEETHRAQIVAANDTAARRGLRVLAVAQRTLPTGVTSYTPEAMAVYANIRKFVAYIFTSNTTEAVPFILFALSGGRIPPALNVMQLLSVDLGTDLVPALALGAEPAEPDAMDRPPRNRHEHVITWSLNLRARFWLGLPQSLAAMAAFYFMYWTNGYWGQWLDLPASGPLYRAATTMTLASIVATQIGNLFAQRMEYTAVWRLHWGRNRLVSVGIASELTLIVLLLYAPVLQQVFGTAPFPLHNWLFLFAWTPLLLLADEGRKALVRRRARGTLRGM